MITTNGVVFHSAEELSGALKRAQEAHHNFEERHSNGAPWSDPDWQFWYASYLLAEQNPVVMAAWIRDNLSLAEVITKWGADFSLPPEPKPPVPDDTDRYRKAESEMPQRDREQLEDFLHRMQARPCWHHPAECTTRAASVADVDRWVKDTYDTRPLMD